MKNWNKKGIYFLKAAALAAAGVVLQGCSGDNAGAVPGEETVSSFESVEFPLDTTMSFTALAGMNGGYTLNDNPAMKKALQDANIFIDFTSVISVDLQEKRNYSLSSGNYPDLFFKTMLEAADLEKYGRQGIFIPLEDLIREYAPNLSEKLDRMNAWEDIRSSDGHIYAFPEIDKQSPAGSVYWINKRWMDNLELEEPESFEELYRVLKAFKEEDANGNGDPDDEIPMSLVDGVDMLLTYADYNYDAESRTAVIEGELLYIPMDERYREFIGYVARLYQEGLLDANTFVQQRNQLETVGLSGDILGSFNSTGAFEIVGRERDDDYIALTPFQEGTYPITKGITVGAAAITDKCRHSEVLVAWLDRFYSEEGGILAWMGIEGGTWELYEDGTWGWILDNGYGGNVTSIRAGSTIQGSQYHPSIQPELWNALSGEVDPDEVYLTEQHAKIVSMGAVPFPAIRYSEKEQAEVEALTTDINAYIDRYLVQVATGELDLEDSWEGYQEALKTMGVDRLVEIYRKAYEDSVQ